jgi:ribosome-binding protein aMBF1 (putative translation factor)
MMKALRSEGGICHAALTMALAILVERIARLPKADRDELFELTKEIPNTENCEERESIVASMLEILEQAPSRVKPMVDQASDLRPTPKLQKWIDFVSERIRALRKQAGLTQEELAAKSGLPQSHISRLESAKHSPSRITLEKIATALGVSVGELDPSA